MTEERLTARQWQERVLETRRRVMEGRRRLWQDGKTTTCPVCDKPTLVGRSDLTREADSDGAVLVFANLHGAQCDACGAEFLEAYEQIAIEERAGTTFRSASRGSITLLGGKKLGTYWPKDIAETLRMHAKDRLRITPLAEDTVVIRIEHPHEEG